MKSSELHIPRWVATVVVLVALIGGGVLALGMRNWSGHEVFGASNLELTMARSSTPVSLGNFSNGFASVLKPALPAVVNIHTSKVVKSRPSQMMPFFNDPVFRQFFGDQIWPGTAGAADGTGTESRLGRDHHVGWNDRDEQSRDRRRDGHQGGLERSSESFKPSSSAPTRRRISQS